MVNSDTYDFCKKQLVDARKGLSTFSSGSGNKLLEYYKRQLAEKYVCPSCSSVFCLECGNKKGHELGTGSTHCPKCGEKVL